MRTLSCDTGKQLSDPSHFSPSKLAWVLEASFWEVLITAGLDIQRKTNCLPTGLSTHVYDIWVP